VTTFESQGSRKGLLGGSGWLTTQDNLAVYLSQNTSKSGIVGTITRTQISCKYVIKY
jgi:hypothetical protein